MVQETADVIAREARRIIEKTHDDKAWAFHNQMATLIAAGAVVIKKDHEMCHMEVDFQRITFVHICERSTFCEGPDAKPLFV